MTKRTAPTDAADVIVADDMQLIVKDKRDVWRASNAKARRRQRRYTKLLTAHLMRVGSDTVDRDDISGEPFESEDRGTD